MTSSQQPNPSRNASYRIDTEHHLTEMLRKAVSRLQVDDLDIQLSRDAILLTGSVESWHDKQHAQESVRNLTGSRYIENNLQVIGGGPESCL